MRHSIRCALAGAAASAGIIALAACPASATVTRQAHHTNVPCDTAALDSAISSAASGDTLVLAAGCTYQTGGLPEISTNLAIVGRGATLEYTFTTAESSIMSVSGGVTVHISNLNFTDGFSLGANASALATEGNVTIDGGTFTGNTGEDGGSAVDNTGQLMVRGAAFTDNGGEAATGGAIDNSGQLTVVATTFTGNDTQLYGTSGGAIVNGGQATLRDDTLTGNAANSGAGGAIVNGGTLAVVSTSITSNTAGTGGAGGISNKTGRVSLRHDCIMSNTPVNCLNVPGCKG